MIHILAKRHVHTLAEFASSNVLLALDYDGTLAPIVSDPSLARLRPSTRRLLASAAARYRSGGMDVLRHDTPALTGHTLTL